MKIKPPFRIEAPKNKKGFGRIARSQFWYVWNTRGKVVQILTWKSNFYLHDESKVRVGGNIAGWIPQALLSLEPK